MTEDPADRIRATRAELRKQTEQLAGLLADQWDRQTTPVDLTQPPEATPDEIAAAIAEAGQPS